jgi:hypothetical protein
MSERKKLWKLNHTAKWSRNLQERKIAIRELSSCGQEALPYLNEILNVTTYGEIKTACREAIRIVKQTQQDLTPKQDSGMLASTRLADLPP